VTENTMMYTVFDFHPQPVEGIGTPVAKNEKTYRIPGQPLPAEGEKDDCCRMEPPLADA
jgi:hypothetical protein